MSPSTDGRWRKAFTVGGLAFSALSVLALFSHRRGPAPIGRVALIGDSYAVGLGPQLAKMLPDFKYEAYVGANTWQWANHKGCGNCGDWLTSFHPHIVLVSLGVNDGASPNPANYQSIVRALHGIGARVIWIEPPAAVSTPARDVIASLGVATVPATTTPLASDKLHPSSYIPWAQETVDAIKG